ncbi:MAG: flippase-like domain-containing protein [Parasporobacterium sp.]|nr:flippase-like domain-containing protein [Parasporobacterium sp.]
MPEDPSKDFEPAPLSQEEIKKKRRSRILWIAIFIVVNGSVIAYTAIDEFSKDRPPLGYKFMFSNVMFIVAGFGCMFLALFLETVKYIVMMKDLGEKVSVKAAFETAALGKYYDNITPSGAGGQPFQIYNMHKSGYSPGVSAAMPLSSFLFMQLAFVFIALIVLIFFGNVVNMLAIRIPAFIGVFCYSIVPFFIILSAISDKAAKVVVGFFIKLGAKLHIVKKPDDTIKSVSKTLDDYHVNLRLIAKKKWLVVKLALLSLLYQIAMCSIPFFVLHAYKGTGSWLYIFAQTVFIYAAITIVPTPGNSGAAEGSFYLIFSQLDYSGLFWGMLIWRFICYYSFIIIGIGIYAYNALARQIQMRKEKRMQQNVENKS